MTRREHWTSRHGLLLGRAGTLVVAVGGAAVGLRGGPRRLAIAAGAFALGLFVLGIAAEERRTGVASVRWGESSRTEARYYRDHEPRRFRAVLCGRAVVAVGLCLVGVLAVLSEEPPG